MKKISILLVIILMISLVACGGPTSESTTDTADAIKTTTAPETTASPETEKETKITESETTAPATEPEETDEPEDTDEPEETPPADTGAESATLTGPYIITTCGQSPGAVQIGMSAKMAEIESVVENTLKAEDLDTAAYKTLIVTTGTSMKGMGAAGTDVDAEIDRCVKLIEKAKEAGMTIVGAHVEGMARRTDSSDTASIEAIMPLADIILVVKESDSDSYFTDFAEENDKAIIVVDNALEIGEKLK